MCKKWIKYNRIILLLFLLLPFQLLFAQVENPFIKIKPLEEKFQPLPIKEIKPHGWLREQLVQNMEGFIGNLDQLVPDLIVADDIYGTERLTKKVKSKDVGALADEGDWQVQFLWWNSETQSNWWDGFIRSAILTGNPAHLKKAKQHIDYIISTQDEDGYIGIYDKDLRYNFDNENGELWAKATVLRGMLAWYEYSEDKNVLSAIENAVQNVMVNYRINNSDPFYTTNPNVGGLSHGLTFTDVLENLFRITKKQNYLDYALFLYQDFSSHYFNEDAQYKKLADTTIPLKGHGVHSYEHLRSVATAVQASGNPNLQIVLENYLHKISITNSASGGPAGDEWIGGRQANATHTGYEYCSLHEMLHSYAELLIKTGQPHFAEKIENLFFNAAQGARHPDDKSIAYLKTDNSYFMTGGLNGDTSVKNQTRYKYSPVHQDAAVCCVPNAGRITPYYIQHMWLKENENLVASLLGPSELTTMLQGKEVNIKQITEYPFTNKIIFDITAKDISFSLKIRKPLWVDKFTVSENYTEEDGFIVISKKWKGNQKIIIEFLPGVQVHQDKNEEYYFTYGALMLAHPIASEAKQTRSFPLNGYYDLMYEPKDLVIYQYLPNQQIKKVGNKLEFYTSLYNPVTEKAEEVQLKPISKTILRQTTFKIRN